VTKSAFDKIAAGLQDAIAFVEGDETRGRVRRDRADPRRRGAGARQPTGT